jgi:UDP-4-amino-4,6-dideoxy-N-acetyl-beta-L-altrosamine N-acetyltransferase
MLKRENYKLRDLKKDDSGLVLEWRNSDHIRANMYTDHIISKEEHEQWFEQIFVTQNSIYMIFEFQHRPIGLVNTSQIDRQNNKCFWAFYLGESNAPRGSGSIMEFLFLEYVFEKLNIRKICCEVLSFNTTTIKLHKKFGFQEEGLFRQHILKNNEYKDVVFMSLFHDSWLEIKPKIQKLCFGN